MTSINPNKLVMADIEKVLSVEPESARTIWKKIDCWAPGSVRKALIELVKLGKARAVLADDPALGRMVHHYARAAA